MQPSMAMFHASKPEQLLLKLKQNLELFLDAEYDTVPYLTLLYWAVLHSIVLPFLTDPV